MQSVSDDDSDVVLLHAPPSNGGNCTEDGVPDCENPLLDFREAVVCGDANLRDFQFDGATIIVEAAAVSASIKLILVC